MARKNRKRNRYAKWGKKVVRMTPHELYDEAMCVLLWVNETEYVLLPTDSDTAHNVAVYDNEYEYDEMDFLEAENKLELLDALDYQLVRLKVILRKDTTTETIGTVRESTTGRVKEISLANSDAIELWFYCQKQVPFIVDRRLLTENNMANETALFTIPSYMLERMLEKRKEGVKSERDLIPEVDNLAKTFQNESLRKEMTIQTLSRLEKLLSESDTSAGLKLAGEVRDYIAQRKEQKQENVRKK